MREPGAAVVPSEPDSGSAGAGTYRPRASHLKLFSSSVLPVPE
jgi:hypothetical protein